MANYSNYPEYEMFYNEVQRKVNIIKSMLSEYELIKNEVQSMEGYEEMEEYISEINKVYNDLEEAYNKAVTYRDRLVYDTSDITNELKHRARYSDGYGV